MPVLLAWCLAVSGSLFGPAVAQEAGSTLGHGDYHLTATDGSEFTQQSLIGAPTAVFFGFTHCPEVCPTTLGEVADWQEELAARDLELRVFFVTVDPERDTLEQLEGYVSWVPGVRGVSGPRKEIDQAIGAFRIIAERVDLDDGNYTMDHSVNVLLFDENGHYVEPIGYQEDHDFVMDKLNDLFAS